MACGKVAEQTVNPFLAQVSNPARRGADDHVLAQALNRISDRLPRCQKVSEDIELAERGKRFGCSSAGLMESAGFALEQQSSQRGNRFRAQVDQLQESGVALMQRLQATDSVFGSHWP